MLDQLQRLVTLQTTPKRIISIVPSQTELLADLGLDAEVIGITKFCVHPKGWLKSKAIIGGTKQLNIDKIRALNPDLIIANKEENTKEQIELLAAFCPVWVSDVYDLASACEMIEKVGEICGKSEDGLLMVKKIQAKFSKINLAKPLQKAAYFIWKGPYMVAGGGTFIHEMMKYTGYENVFGDQLRYPPIMLSELAAKQPDVILLSSEPYPFKFAHFEPFQKACPNVLLVWKSVVRNENYINRHLPLIIFQYFLPIYFFEIFGK
jgi:ABC-type Fe3+-hydroxamate transport system substrate-binding protein